MMPDESNAAIPANQGETPRAKNKQGKESYAACIAATQECTSRVALGGGCWWPSETEPGPALPMLLGFIQSTPSVELGLTDVDGQQLLMAMDGCECQLPTTREHQIPTSIHSLNCHQITLLKVLPFFPTAPSKPQAHQVRTERAKVERYLET